MSRGSVSTQALVAPTHGLFIMIFQELAPKDLTRVSRIGIRKRFRAGEYVIKEGEEGTWFALVLSGKLEVRKDVSDDRAAVLVKLKPGDVVGEMGFFDVQYRSAAVIAKSDCDLYVFEREAFDSLMTDRPKIAAVVYRALARVLAQRLAETDTRLGRTVFWAVSPRSSEPNRELLDKLRIKH